MGMIKEFKEFAMRGNVLDLAIGVIIGAAFGAIVNSAVNDVIMPPIGMAAGQLDFKDLFLSLNGQTYPSLAAAKTAGAPVIAYGSFLNTVVNFLIVALVIFMIVKQVNRLNKPAAAPVAAPSTKDCPYCANSVPLKAVRCGFCTSDLSRA
jgi:large conductance mechanosensitive channel